MSETMITRNSLKAAHTATGLQLEDILTRTGIPLQSFKALMEDQDGKDPQMLISDSTFKKLARTLCLNDNMSGLRTDSVIEWSFSKKNSKPWFDAVANLRKSQFSTDDAAIDLLIIYNKSSRLFTQQDAMIFICDIENHIHLAITSANKSAAQKIATAFGINSPRTTSMPHQEFDITTKLIRNSVFRISQFNVVLGGKATRYNWADVQAAAKEFNFTTDSLIELMVKTAQSKAEDQKLPATHQSTQHTEVPFLRVASSNH